MEDLGERGRAGDNAHVFGFREGQPCTEEFIGDLRGVSQPTVSRVVTVLVPLIKAVLEEFVPDITDAIEVVDGRVVLVDGAITPCWS